MSNVGLSVFVKMSVFFCLLFALMGFYVCLGRAESGRARLHPKPHPHQGESSASHFVPVVWVSAPRPLTGYVDQEENPLVHVEGSSSGSVIAPRPQRPPKGVLENLFFSGIELTADWVRAVPKTVRRVQENYKSEAFSYTLKCFFLL